MKLKVLAGISLITFSLHAAAESSVKTPEEKLSYSLGVMMADQLQQQFEKVDTNALSQGIKDAIAGSKLKVSREEMPKLIEAAYTKKQKQIQAERKVQAEANLKKGKEFLAENAKKPGVTTLKNGLQYKVITAGKGEKPTDTDEVTVNYEGRLIDGTVFDSSYKRGEPTTFPLDQVIKGWQEALKQMPKGSTWEVYIPADLAYGPAGAPGAVGPNEVLIFKVELLDIKKQTKQTTKPKTK
ncbi:FKBP-type peptidyl-prolyl cis-trans isomerase [Candidatus Sororendozoicomonas aggregata]|uniref:FKBP-type peptidyl-prolyl cis-trans isomerase n=1 Tax=Candidatus Sororendozoicomonas aggregata TaxID=3073239 RepID=UPI002ED01471